MELNNKQKENIMDFSENELIKVWADSLVENLATATMLEKIKTKDGKRKYSLSSDYAVLVFRGISKIAQVLNLSTSTTIEKAGSFNFKTITSCYKGIRFYSIGVTQEDSLT